jgi:hypothetical protein
VVHGDRVGALEIRNRARDAQDPAAGARREVEALRHELKEVAGLAIWHRVALELAHGECAGQDPLAVKLQRAGAGDPRADQRARVAEPRACPWRNGPSAAVR